MRTIAIILICLALAAPGFTQATAPMPVPPGVSVSFSNVPLKQAIEELFRQTTMGYTFDPALDQTPFDQISVSLKLMNADFEQALSALLDRNGLAWTREEGRYHIAPSGAPPQALANQTLRFARQSEAADLATVNLPSMPVKEALSTVWPQSPWTFRGELGRTTMPGAKFYQFPRPMAGATVVLAAGLIPPTANERLVASRGKGNVTEMYQWSPPRLSNQQVGDIAGLVRLQGPANQLYANNAQWAEAGVAISAYRSRTGDTWFFTILANRALDIDVLERLFALSGKAYVMGDLTKRPQTVRLYSDALPSAEKTSPEAQSRLVVRGPKLISAQLRDVTLDQALGNLLPAAGLAYRKIGPPNSLTYVIEVPPLIPQ